MFYLKLYNTEFWDGWSVERATRVLILAAIFVLCVLLFHGAFHGCDFNSALWLCWNCRKGSDHRFDFFVAEDLVDPGFFDVEDFTPQGKNGLKTPVASLFGRSAGRISLNYIYLGLFPYRGGAVGELAR